MKKLNICSINRFLPKVKISYNTTPKDQTSEETEYLCSEMTSGADHFTGKREFPIATPYLSKDRANSKSAIFIVNFSASSFP